MYYEVGSIIIDKADPTKEFIIESFGFRGATFESSEKETFYGFANSEQEPYLYEKDGKTYQGHEFKFWFEDPYTEDKYILKPLNL